jgi:hypothetical protein
MERKSLDVANAAWFPDCYRVLPGITSLIEEFFFRRAIFLALLQFID